MDSAAPAAIAVAGERPRLVATLLTRQSLWRCIPIALIVGTVLSLVNQGSVIFGGKATYVTWIRVVTNYLIPFCVSSTGFFTSQRAVWKTTRLAAP